MWPARNVPRAMRRKARQRECGGELRAVDQREAFLRAKLDRAETGRGQRLAAGHHITTEFGLAMPHHHGCHMCQRRQIARGPNRALRRDHRNDATLQHLLDLLDHQPADP